MFLIDDLFKNLNEKCLTLSVAESCTGGSLSAKICSFPGISSIFKGGIVAYSDNIKIDRLNINPNDIIKYGAVSSQVASQMSNSVMKLFNTDIGVSTTGYSVPTGDEVGMVFVSFSMNGKKTIVKEFNFKGSRSDIIEQTILSSLEIIFNQIN